MRLLVGFWDYCPHWHRPRPALVAETLLGPHFGQAMNDLVPCLLGLVGVDAEAAEFGPRRRASGADLEPPAGNDIHRGGALGDLDRMVELGHADDDAVADADVLGL